MRAGYLLAAGDSSVGVPVGRPQWSGKDSDLAGESIASVATPTAVHARGGADCSRKAGLIFPRRRWSMRWLIRTFATLETAVLVVYVAVGYQILSEPDAVGGPLSVSWTWPVVAGGLWIFGVCPICGLIVYQAIRLHEVLDQACKAASSMREELRYRVNARDSLRAVFVPSSEPRTPDQGSEFGTW